MNDKSMIRPLSVSKGCFLATWRVSLGRGTLIKLDS